VVKLDDLEGCLSTSNPSPVILRHFINEALWNFDPIGSKRAYLSGSAQRVDFLTMIALVQAMPVPKLKLILECLVEAVKATSSRALTRTLTAPNRRVSLLLTGRWFKRVKAGEAPA
jgi:hypothetical protein